MITSSPKLSEGPLKKRRAFIIATRVILECGARPEWWDFSIEVLSDLEGIRELTGHSRVGRTKKGKAGKMFLLAMQMSQGLALAKEQFDKLEKLWEGICSHLSFAFYFL